MSRRDDLLADIDKLNPPRVGGGVDVSRIGWSFLRYLSDDELAVVRRDMVDTRNEATARAREWMTEADEGNG